MAPQAPQAESAAAAAAAAAVADEGADREVELKAAGVEAEAGAGQALALSQRMKASFQSSCGTLDQVDTAVHSRRSCCTSPASPDWITSRTAWNPTSASPSNGRPVKTAQTEKQQQWQWPHPRRRRPRRPKWKKLERRDKTGKVVSRLLGRLHPTAHLWYPSLK